MSVTIERSFHLASVAGRTGGARRILRDGQEPESAPAPPTGRVPRIAKLMALAIRCEQLLRSGAVPDATALARLAHVTQPRMTQILNLTLLSPDIQEALLFLLPVEVGKADITEKAMRPMCSQVGWESQRVIWVDVRSEGGQSISAQRVAAAKKRLNR